MSDNECYKLQIKHRLFDLGTDLDMPEADFTSHGHPLTALFESMVAKLNEHPRLAAITPRLTPDNTECPLPFSDSGLECEVIFVDKEEALILWDTRATDGSAPMGVHAISSGAFEQEDEDFLSKKHRVVVNISPEKLTQIMVEERLLETDPFNNRHDREYLEAYLTTLTHELQHCIEFIENGNGYTPSDIGNLSEFGEIEHSVFDVSTGFGILYPATDELGTDEIIDRMEDRVEGNARVMTGDIVLNEDLVQQALSAVSPSQSMIEERLAQATQEKTEVSLGR